MKIEIIGLYAIPESEEPCHLAEWRLSNYDGPFEIGAVIQPVQGEPREHCKHLGMSTCSGSMASPAN